MASDHAFTGSIPALYEQLLVPLIFAPYADDLARRAAALQPAAVLETACGTGVVTRRLAAMLPPACTLTATDLNAPMLAHARSLGAARPVQWQVADAMALPFEAASFDLVACQFGAMFFPDRAHAFAQARHVLRPGGTLLFNVWDAIEANDLAEAVTQALAGLFPDDPPRFLARTPHGCHDLPRLRAELAAAGFADDAVTIETLTLRSIADSPRQAARAYCEGTPLRNEIEARGGDALARATDCATQALERRWGSGRIDAPMRAHVVQARY